MNREQDWLAQIAAGLGQVRVRQPIIHHITNYISINDCVLEIAWLLIFVTELKE